MTVNASVHWGYLDGLSVQHHSLLSARGRPYAELVPKGSRKQGVNNIVAIAIVYPVQSGYYFKGRAH